MLAGWVPWLKKLPAPYLKDAENQRWPHIVGYWRVVGGAWVGRPGGGPAREEATIAGGGGLGAYLGSTFGGTALFGLVVAMTQVRRLGLNPGWDPANPTRWHRLLPSCAAQVWHCTPDTPVGHGSAMPVATGRDQGRKRRRAEMQCPEREQARGRP